MPFQRVTKDFTVDRQLTKSMKNRQDSSDVSVGASELAEAVKSPL